MESRTYNNITLFYGLKYTYFMYYTMLLYIIVNTTIIIINDLKSIV